MKNTPKKIHFRLIDNGTKISVGEYVNARRRAVCDPFEIGTVYAALLKNQISEFTKRTGRAVVACTYGNPILQNLAKEMGIQEK